MTADLSKNLILCSFHKCSYFSSKWVNFYILVILLSYHDDFLPFKRLSRKWTKLKISIDDRGPVEKWDFLLFSQMFILFIQMSGFYILVVLLSYHDDFLHFKTLSREWPKLKYSNDDRGPVEKCDFYCFYKCSYFSSKWVNFLHFSCPAVIPWWFSSF